jgi:hypothetical protein
MTSVKPIAHKSTHVNARQRNRPLPEHITKLEKQATTHIGALSLDVRRCVLTSAASTDGQAL